MSAPQVDGVVVIGPECFADSEETVICWRGRNYYRPVGDGPPPRPERVVKAEALREVAAQAWEVDGAEDPTRTAFLWLRARANHIEAGESS